MKNLLQLKNLKNLARLVALLATLLCCSLGAYADTTYYFGYSTTSDKNPDNFTYTQATMTGNVASITISGFTVSQRAKVTLSTSSTYSGICSQVSSSTFSPSGDAASNQEKNEWGGKYFWAFVAGATSITFSVDVSAGTWCFNVSAGSSPTPTCTYSMQHPWGTDYQWGTWKTLSGDSSTGYSVTAIYGEGGCDISTDGGTNKTYYGSPTVEGGAKKGDECIFTFTPASSTCSREGGTVTITKKVVSLTWTLRGGFNGFSSDANPFVSVGENTIRATIVLPANTTYNNGETEPKGFKVVSSDGSNLTWYGCNSKTITADNNTATLSTSSANCGLTTQRAGLYTFDFNTETKVVTVTYPASQILPSIRIGDKTKEESNYDITVSAYVARTGCNEITSFKVYYSKNQFTNGNEDGVYIKEFTSLSPTPGLNDKYNCTLLATNDLKNKGWGNGDHFYVRVSGVTSAGESALSDIDHIIYITAEPFTVTTPFAANFTACDGEHQFNILDMVTPMPDKVTVTSGTASDFTFANGIATWSTKNKTTGNYSYTLSFERAGYTTASGVVNISYKVDIPTGAIAITSPAVDGTETTPWTAVALTAKATGEEFDAVTWSVTPVGLLIDNGYNKETGVASASFKGKVPTKDSQVFTVTVSGKSETCGAVTATRTFVIKKDVEECTSSQE